MKDWLRERDKKGAYANIITFIWPQKFQEIFAYEYRHLSGSFNYFRALEAWTLNSKKKKEEILVFRVLESTLPN